MKKILNKIFAAFLIITTVTTLSACGNKKNQKLTNIDLAIIYKEVAISTWEKIGVNDPTVAVSALSVSIPDKKEETTDEHQITNILSNSNTMAGMIYMISLLYENENFVTTNNIAVFDVNVNIFGTTYTQNYILSTFIDTNNDKVYLEAAITTMGMVQYSNVEVDYDFDEKEVKSYRFYSNVITSYVDMSLSEDNKYLWYETEDATDEFAIAVTNKKQTFLESASEVEKLEANFDQIMQTYMDVVERAVVGQ